MITKLPAWIRVKVKPGGTYNRTHELLRSMKLHTVCEQAHCPNAPECFGQGTATFLILGPYCTRCCSFCAVEKRHPVPLDPSEPQRVAHAVSALNLRHVVITSVTRDDLPDGGAGHFAQTIETVRAIRTPPPIIEVLTPDFGGNEEALRSVIKAMPDIFNHNLETVARLQESVRPQASYQRSLSVLRFVADHSEGRIKIKSGLMLGLGETEEEILNALRDLRSAGCEWLTLGQYLAPSPRHASIKRFVTPEEFAALGNVARAMGFDAVASGPLVRSSYNAEHFAAATTLKSGRRRRRKALAQPPESKAKKGRGKP